MAVNPDFRDLFAALNGAEARYLVVGAYAVIHHTEPRYTKDVDLWVEPTADNAARVLEALRAFGAPILGLDARDLCDPELVYQIGIEPNRIDLLTSVEGLVFETAWTGAVETTYGGAPIRVLGLEDLITAKKAAGRPQDLLDATRLEQARQRRARGE
jgi:predicted nucleotidyltransferase